MNAMHRLLLPICLLLAGAAWAAGDAAPDADLGEDCAYHRPRLAAAPADMPKFQRAGEVAVGGVQIAAYSLSLSDGGLGETGFSTYAPGKRGPNIALKPETASQLEAYGTPMGTILVPRGWTPRSAAKGVDGSFFINFAPDTSGQSYMTVENTSACVGCAYSAASRYFDTARALAQRDGFVYCRSAKGVHSVPLNAVQRAYAVDTGGNSVDGLAYFNPDDDLMFYAVEISAPLAQHALASAVLNQFVIPRAKAAR